MKRRNWRKKRTGWQDGWLNVMIFLAQSIRVHVLAKMAVCNAGAMQPERRWGKMKLTQAQIKALQAVAKGKVELYEPHDMRKPIKIWGAHTGVITRLADAHLIKPVPTDSFTTKVFVLTEAGQKALETKND